MDIDILKYNCIRSFTKLQAINHIKAREYEKILTTLLFIIFATLAFSLSQRDDTEESNPMFDVEIERPVYIMDIEGTWYIDVNITMKST